MQSNFNNAYINFEPNKSERDNFNLNYQSRPIRKPTELSQNYANRWFTEKKSTYKGNRNVYCRY
jgi:hypothetical protein